MAYMPSRDEVPTLLLHKGKQGTVCLTRTVTFDNRVLLSPFSLHFMGVEYEKINPSNIENYEQ